MLQWNPVVGNINMKEDGEMFSDQLPVVEGDQDDILLHEVLRSVDGPGTGPAEQEIID